DRRERSLRAGVRLESLIDDLLEATNLETGRLNVTASPVDVAAVVEHTVESFRARRKEIALSLPSEDPSALADAERLEQVLSNILDNAIKYSPVGSAVTVTVRSVRADVDVVVSARGRGIDPALLSRVYEPC